MADQCSLFLKINTRPPEATPPVCSACKGEVIWDEGVPLCVNCTAFVSATSEPPRPLNSPASN